MIKREPRTATLLARLEDIISQEQFEFEKEYREQCWGKTDDGKYPAEKRLKVMYANTTARLFEGMSTEETEIALAALATTDPRGKIMMWLHNEHYLRRKPLRRRTTVMKRIPPIVKSPIILASLQRHSETSHPEPPPIAAETSIEIMHRLNWATRDLAIRKRRDELQQPSTARNK
jgi:hypothetical protein